MNILDDIFEYDCGALKWKARRYSNAMAGHNAGTVRPDGYLQVSLFGKTQLVHRVIWEMHNGPIPDGMEIDHINHDRLDNRIENLRIVSRQENSVNLSKRIDNTSGIVGVSWSKRMGKWRARISVNKKEISLGFFSDINDAGRARKNAEIYYNFHENHGKSNSQSFDRLRRRGVD